MVKEQETSLVFTQNVGVKYATNTFIATPVILQFDDDPIIEVVQTDITNVTTQMRIYNNDGVYLAKVKGPRLFLTDDGKKTDLSLRHPAGKTVCELAGQTLFEINRQSAAAVEIEAELYTPTGSFVKARGAEFLASILQPDSEPLQVGNITVGYSVFVGVQIGVHVMSNGSAVIGVGKSKSVASPKDLISNYEKLLKSNPKDSELLRRLGILNSRIGNIDQAVDFLKRAVEQDKGDSSSHFNLGIAWSRKEDYQTAVPCFEQAVKLAENVFDPHYNLGIALNKMGRNVDAITTLSRAVEINPSDPGALYHLSRNLALEGKEDEALEALEKSVGLAPQRSSRAAKTDDAFRRLWDHDRFKVITRHWNDPGHSS